MKHYERFCSTIVISRHLRKSASNAFYNSWQLYIPNAILLPEAVIRDERNIYQSFLQVSIIMVLICVSIQVRVQLRLLMFE